MFVCVGHIHRHGPAAAPGKARLQSCPGSFASIWLTVWPTTDALTFENFEILVAVKCRLGMAIGFDGPDIHGHRSLTTNVERHLSAKYTALLVV